MFKTTNASFWIFFPKIIVYIKADKYKLNFYLDEIQGEKL